MTFKEEQLDRIYHRTGGYCHICHKKLSRQNYGRPGERASWEVEHSVPRACGGTDHMNNLFAACGSCNRAKGALTSRTARTWNAKTKAPMSRLKRRAAKKENTLFGTIGGGLAGLVLAGPVGCIFGAVAGGKFGS